MMQYFAPYFHVRRILKYHFRILKAIKCNEIQHYHTFCQVRVKFLRKIKLYRSVPKSVWHLLELISFGRECSLKSGKKTPIGDVDLSSTIVQLKVEMLSTLVDFKEIIEILYHVFSCL